MSEQPDSTPVPEPTPAAAPVPAPQDAPYEVAIPTYDVFQKGADTGGMETRVPPSASSDGD